jgi:hypothetical protein
MQVIRRIGNWFKRLLPVLSIALTESFKLKRLIFLRTDPQGVPWLPETYFSTC